MSKSKIEYRTGDLPKFVSYLCGYFKLDAGLVKAVLVTAFPQLKDKSACPNCGASMEEYLYHFDTFKVALLLAMAKEVRHRQTKGYAFTEANKVHIPSLTSSHTVKCQTTQASKLGLVAQVRNESGKRLSGTWLITRRGWEALAGKPVPKSVRVWRGKIEERTDETITMAEAMRSHIDRVRELVAKRKKPKVDLSQEFSEYDPSLWVEYAGVHEGKVI